MAENDFDLSGLAELQASQGDDSQPAEVETSPEASADNTPAEVAKSTWKVGNTEYDDPAKMQADYEQMLKAYTPLAQRYAADNKAQAQVSQAPQTTAPQMEQSDLTPEQTAELQKLMKAAGFVSREELEADRQAQAQAAAQAQFEAEKTAFLKSHDGSDGLPKADEAKVLQYMQENAIYNFDAAYKSMYMDKILEAKAQELFSKKVGSVQPEHSSPGSAVNPAPAAKPNFDDPKSVLAAIQDLGLGQ